MNKKSKILFVCGVALMMMTIATQQNVKADTLTNNQTENAINNDDSQSQVVQSTIDANQTQSMITTNQPQSTQSIASNEDINDESQTATTQDTQVSSSITPVKGVVTTNDKLTYLYTKEGTQITNRALGPNTPWVTDQRLANSGKTYYRVATNEFTDSNDVTLSFGAASDGTVRVTSDSAVGYARIDDGFIQTGQSNFGVNSLWKYNRTDNDGGLTYYQIATNVWVNSNDVTDAPVYQNPSDWLQIHNSQIQPVGTPGYPLYNGVEGIKTWLVRRYFGLSNAHTIYDGSAISAVSRFQAQAGLPVTGITDLATWKAMGFSEDSWYGIDSYVAPLRTNVSSTRSDHVEAMISEAYKYVGKPWISGAASSPDYGVDCSGLVTQALYASGIDSAPVSAIQHAQVGNEWNCQMYWNDNRIHRINFNDRQRGDLIFFTDPSSGMLWHVGILLDPSTMIESWPYAVQVHSIYSGRGNIAGVKRVFA